jgi:hypothetical protein
MGLLTSSGSSVTMAVAGKAAGTWAVQRPFGGVDFSASMGTVGSSGQIRRFCRHYWMRGCKGFGREQEGGENKCLWFFVNRVTGLTPIF